jgi:hypothetical protein
MASDEDYAAFLEKANEDPSKGVAKTESQRGGKMQLRAVDKGAKVPAGLKSATKEAFYVSDSDEPFEAVVLKLVGKGLPDEGTLFPLVRDKGDDLVGNGHGDGDRANRRVLNRDVCEIGQPSKSRGRRC